MKFLEEITKDNSEINRYILTILYDYARAHSDDSATHIGAAITQDDMNEFYCATNMITQMRRKDIQPCMLRHPAKKRFIKHAEHNIFVEARKQNIQIEGATIYSNGFPCMDCAELLTKNKIGRLVFHKDMVLRTPKDEKSNLYEAYEHLNKNYINMHYYEGTLGVPARMGEEEWDA